MIIQSMAGLLVFSAIAWLISENHKKVKVKPVIAGYCRSAGDRIHFVEVACF